MKAGVGRRVLRCRDHRTRRRLVGAVYSAVYTSSSIRRRAGRSERVAEADSFWLFWRPIRWPRGLNLPISSELFGNANAANI